MLPEEVRKRQDGKIIYISRRPGNGKFKVLLSGIQTELRPESPLKRMLRKLMRKLKGRFEEAKEKYQRCDWKP